MKALYSFFTIIAVLALVVLLFVSVDARRGETCPCTFIGDCYYDGNIGYRYYQCGASCAAYSGWQVATRCIPPELTVIGEDRTIVVE